MADVYVGLRPGLATTQEEIGGTEGVILDRGPQNEVLGVEVLSANTVSVDGFDVLPDIAREEYLAALLHIAYFDLHPTYSNTSHRGRGIGGWAITQQCSFLAPEEKEAVWLAKIDQAVRDAFQRAEERGMDFTAYVESVRKGLIHP
jgi:hypothetical protein